VVVSVLSYWRDYFDPHRSASGANHSTGLIAAALHRLLSSAGPVTYYDNAEVPRGVQADLFVGHFWSFADMCEANHFRRRVAVYVLSDPTRARDLLTTAAADHRVPMCDWDLPPASFDHEATMALADVVLVCGNSHTLATFPPDWRPKIRLFNYGLDPGLWAAGGGGPAGGAGGPPPGGRDFVYVGTHCGLRKGFLDVIATWRDIPPEQARLHVIGHLDPPYDRRLADANRGNVIVHGWMDSRSPRYRARLASCRFAYIPTWFEGQMGTLLETIFAGCVPITTAAAGVDDDVLRHCVVVEPMRPDQHRAAIDTVLGWDQDTYLARRDALIDAARRRHSWDVFDQQVGPVLAGDRPGRTGVGRT
jgi:glycosyltransferase involved in cell wall biosynthesis